MNRRKRPLKGSGMIDRRDFLTTGGAFAGAPTPMTTVLAKAAKRGAMQANHAAVFWPGSARLVISVSMQVEAGDQLASGAESPLPKTEPKYPDIAATKWYDYGFKEGLPRLLDMFDRHKVKVTSHMVGAAVEKHPALAREMPPSSGSSLTMSHGTILSSPPRKQRADR